MPKGQCKYRDTDSNACKLRQDWCEGYDVCDDYVEDEGEDEADGNGFVGGIGYGY